MRRFLTGLTAIALCSGPAAAQSRDPVNPTCPAQPDWSNYPSMQFRVVEKDGTKVLLAEGRIDETTPSKLQSALDEHPDVEQIRLRSPGGDARAGTQAGFIIRQHRSPELWTHVPAGWTCFSACNFMFMGGRARSVEPGGVFMVHMFTHLADGSATRQQATRGGEGTVGLIGEIEQASALLATEDNDFLIRMGVSRNLLSEVMYQVRAVPTGRNTETRRCLNAKELEEYGVTNIEWEE